MRHKKITADKFFLLTTRKPTWPLALRIALIYLCFGSLWIFISDVVLYKYIIDSHGHFTLSIYKGIIFVLLSTLIIFFLVYTILKKLSDKEQVILENRNELKTMLYYDHLTGLSNRRKLTTRLPDFLEDGTQKKKAVILLDIDNIKLINDTLGHLIGDRLIIEITHRLTRALTPPDEIYRFGGDEFLILSKFSELILLKEKAVTLLDLFEQPFSIEGHYIHSSVSIGISLFPVHSTNPDELLKFADMAMYQSKKAGKNCSVLYTPNLSNEMQEKFNIGKHLYNAIENLEMAVHYQPQINAETHALVGFEALLRWNNPELGFVSPDKFIQVAEETHLIYPLGEWVLRQSCSFLKKLNQQGYSNLYISVNISMLQLIQGNFNYLIESVLKEYDLKPNQLELEITESVLMRSPQIVLQQLASFKNKGIRIALDDFGKGYSSLSHLENLPLNTLKIDKSFIDGITDIDKDTSLTGNIVKIGKKLGLVVIAEGVEHQNQLEYLVHQQCDIIQGWYFSKALPEVEAEHYAQENFKNEQHI